MYTTKHVHVCNYIMFWIANPVPGSSSPASSGPASSGGSSSSSSCATVFSRVHVFCSEFQEGYGGPEDMCHPSGLSKRLPFSARAETSNTRLNIQHAWNVVKSKICSKLLQAILVVKGALDPKSNIGSKSQPKWIRSLNPTPYAHQMLWQRVLAALTFLSAEGACVSGALCTPASAAACSDSAGG